MWKLLLLLLGVCLVGGHSTYSSAAQHMQERNKSYHPDLTSAGCTACQGLMALIDNIIQMNGTEDDIVKIATDFCIIGKIELPEVCAGIVSEFAPEILYILTHKYLEPLDFCIDIRVCPNTTMLATTTDTLAQRIARGKSYAKKSVPKPWKRVGDPNVGTFFQITDLHLDVFYQAGTNASCGMPECCRVVNGYVPKTDPASAGPFGNHHCNSPYILLQSLMAKMTSVQPDPDFILWTGDDSPDDVWEQSQGEILGYAHNISSLLQATFPHVNTYTALGNHEGFPVDQFRGPGYDNWLYDSVAEYWAPWLNNDTEAIAQLQYGGFYSTLIRPGLRVIAMNTMFGQVSNFWLLLNSTDVGGQITWLQTTLEKAKQANERVYIIGHIPNNSGNLLENWANDVNTVVSNYSDVIAASFYGHTHMDGMAIMFNGGYGSEPVGIAFVCPSVTPETNINPSFRIYYYDRTSFEVLDYDQYTVDLAKANSADEIDWQLIYSPLTDYNMTALTPQDYWELVVRLNQNTTESNIVLERIMSHHVTEMGIGGCMTNPACRTDTICSIASYTNDMYNACWAHPPPLATGSVSDPVQTVQSGQ